MHVVGERERGGGGKKGVWKVISRWVLRTIILTSLSGSRSIPGFKMQLFCIVALLNSSRFIAIPSNHDLTLEITDVEIMLGNAK